MINLNLGRMPCWRNWHDTYPKSTSCKSNRCITTGRRTLYSECIPMKIPHKESEKRGLNHGRYLPQAGIFRESFEGPEDIVPCLKFPKKNCRHHRPESENTFRNNQRGGRVVSGAAAPARGSRANQPFYIKTG